jgi:hypothetical protein
MIEFSPELSSNTRAATSALVISCFIGDYNVNEDYKFYDGLN